MNEWSAATVSQLQRDGVLLVEDGNHGEYRPRPDEFTDHGVAFIRAADIGPTGIAFGSASRINEQARHRITKGIGRPGDVLLSHKGTVGKVAIAPDDSPPYVCSPQTTFWRTLDETRLNRKYLYVFMRSAIFHAQLAARAAETDMAPYVSLTSQRGLTVSVPPIAVQEAIANIISPFDDKIDLNRRMNETLEAMAEAIFKDWFVNFGPTRAKMEGLAPYLAPEIWKLFPDRLDTEGKPEGWETKSIGDFIERLSVGKKFEQKTVAPMGLVPVLDQGRSGVIGYHNEEAGVIASEDRPVVVFANHTCLMRLVHFQFSSIQNVLPFIGQNVDTVWAYYATVGKQSFIEYKGHWPDFIVHKVCVPEPNVTHVFGGLVRPLLKRTWSAESESAILTSTRDSLLSKLISGEIRVKDADRIAEAAL